MYQGVKKTMVKLEGETGNMERKEEEMRQKGGNMGCEKRVRKQK